MADNNFGLPRDLGDGLTLRWAGEEDAEALATFNIAMHSDDPNEPELWVGERTRELMNGRHPSTKASDFTIVQNEAGEIVSSLCTISQTWSYAGIEFGVGRPELVATLEPYRRRGLVRTQFELIHALSAARGELVQAITGVPWYYRQFGYEMTLELDGGRPFNWPPSNQQTVANPETYQARAATTADIPPLHSLYHSFQAQGLVSCVRTPQQWQYEMLDRHRDVMDSLDVWVIMAGAELVGYVEYKRWGSTFIVRELVARPGHSWRAIALFVIRWLKTKADEMNEAKAGSISHIFFALGSQSSVYEALGSQIGPARPSYAWYVRVPDMQAFLHHITPALEERLAQSVVAGHNGRLRLNFYKSQLGLHFENGRIVEIAPYQAAGFDGPEDGDCFFPDHTFLHLLFGQRTFQEIRHLRADCFATSYEAIVLLGALFPQRPSWIRPLS